MTKKRLRKKIAKAALAHVRWEGEARNLEHHLRQQREIIRSAANRGEHKVVYACRRQDACHLCREYWMIDRQENLAIGMSGSALGELRALAKSLAEIEDAGEKK